MIHAYLYIIISNEQSYKQNYQEIFMLVSFKMFLFLSDWHYFVFHAYYDFLRFMRSIYEARVNSSIQCVWLTRASYFYSVLFASLNQGKEEKKKEL